MLICRRAFLSGAVALFLIALALGPAAAGDWPQFLGPRRDGTSDEKVVAWDKFGPAQKWEKEIGAGFSGPVVAGGRLILFHRVGDEEVVECLDAATGQGRWRFAYPTGYRDAFGMDNGPRASPLVAGGRVYTLGAEGSLHCLELDGGKKVWARALHTEYEFRKGFFGVATSPLLEGDLLLVNVGAKAAGIVAFDRNTGKEVWKATDHEASYSSPVAATVHGKRYAFFFTREGLVGLDPRDGTVRFSKRWRSRMHASVNAAAPLVIGDQVFVSSSYNTGAILSHIRPDGTQEAVWQGDESMSNHYGTCVYRDGCLYGFDGRQEYGCELRCVDWDTGKVRWKKEGFGCGSLILAGGQLVILTEDGDLVLAEATPAAYREKARASVLSKPVRALPALADGRLYARDGKKLVCLGLKK